MTASTGPTFAMDNLEHDPEFVAVWPTEQAELVDGFTAVLRVKNEAASLPFVLPPLFEAVEEIVLVDNLSDDGTPEVARETAERCGAADRLRVFTYPFNVSRCGQEHLETPAASVHSLTHFYNWSFSHVRTRYSLKWDGDMVLTPEGVRYYRALEWQLGNSRASVTMPRLGLYVQDETQAFLDVGLFNRESYGYPMAPDFTYIKAFEWEMRHVPADAAKIMLPEGICIELKWLDGDEFSHWTDPAAYDAARQGRKKREWEVFHGLQAGEVPADVLPVQAPEGVHVVDHVSRTFLPQLPRPISESADAKDATIAAGIVV
ncbi:hypothetical protein KUV85_13160 [Nocardioides panacisoli]|uniref:hypothetical protein n=1 Tax=Nocardioides panacisoli TaxID=627624 RepID=UPI001C626A1D|nr:hypothetical protein [Nocardioides panacisoli]QYJ03276.1 hypothetical protein KUV85_13160 [Nocardioides panacisoli]